MHCKVHASCDKCNKRTDVRRFEGSNANAAALVAQLLAVNTKALNLYNESACHDKVEGRRGIAVERTIEVTVEDAIQVTNEIDM